MMKHRHGRARQAQIYRTAGFTLLELLISVMILATIVAIIYGSFTSVVSTMDQARVAAERLRFRQVVWRNFTNNFQGVYADAAFLQPEYQFLGEGGDGAHGPADSLRFVTSLPMPGPRSLPGVTKVVTYSVVDWNEAGDAITDALPYDEDRPGSILRIREEPLMLESQDFVARVQDPAWDIYEQAVPVASVDIQYYDGMQNEWLDAWDSLVERRLPGGIRVKVNFPRSEAERTEAYQAGIDIAESPDLEIMMSFPVGRDVEYPFPDFNHLRLDSDAILE